MSTSPAIEAITHTLRTDTIELDALLRADLGIDSLTGTFIVARLKKTTGVRVPLPVLLESETVAVFTQKVDALIADAA